MSSTLHVHVLAGLRIQQAACIEDARVPVGKSLTRSSTPATAPLPVWTRNPPSGALAGDQGGFAVVVGARVEAFQAIALPASRGRDARSGTRR